MQIINRPPPFVDNGIIQHIITSLCLINLSGTIGDLFLLPGR